MISMTTREISSSASLDTYDVFLSFRGTDTRKNFTDHLYTALIQAGYHTFRDDDEIERGNKIDSELRKAIKQSKISIIIFSKNYASSGWCLSELSKIIESKKTSKHEVLPVFYDVTPSQVRKQTGSYGEAFDRHEKHFSNEKEGNMVKLWRAALEEVADIAGMELKNEADGHESKFVQKILKLVGNKLKRRALTVVPFPVGTNSKVRGISSWINTSTDDILAICGVDGIGKTTIAKIVFNQYIERFEGGSFLSDIGQTLDQQNGLIHLQKQLLSDIAQEEEAEIHSVDEGFSTIKRVISPMKVLLVLDDVNSIDQLNAVVGTDNWLCPGSKIIVTTTNEHLCENPKMEIHKVEKLQDDDSLRLLCLHAFKKDHPAVGYNWLASEVACHCGGVPLALEIVGSSLFGNTLDEWKKKLKQLKDIPNGRILNILRVVFDSLSEYHDKHLFLDIALYFVGKDKDNIVKGLMDCGFFPIPGIENLKDMCLIRVDQDNKLVMHQLVRDMAKEIIHEESNGHRELGQAWPPRDSIILLRKLTLIFFGIIGASLLLIFLLHFMENFERKYVCPIFHKGKDAWICGDVSDLYKNVFKLMPGFSDDMFEHKPDLSKNMFEIMPNFPKNMFENKPDFPKYMFENVPDFPKNMFENVTDFPNDMFENVTDFPKNMLENVPDFPKNMFENVPDFPNNMFENVPDIPKNISIA